MWESGAPNQLVRPNTQIQHYSPVPRPGVEYRLFFFLIEKGKKVRRPILHANGPQSGEPINM